MATATARGIDSNINGDGNETSTVMATAMTIYIILIQLLAQPPRECTTRSGVYPNHWYSWMHPNYWGSQVHPNGWGSWMHPNGRGSRVWPGRGGSCAPALHSQLVLCACGSWDLKSNYCQNDLYFKDTSWVIYFMVITKNRTNLCCSKFSIVLKKNRISFSPPWNIFAILLLSSFTTSFSYPHCLLIVDLAGHLWRGQWQPQWRFCPALIACWLCPLLAPKESSFHFCCLPALSAHSHC